MSARVRREGVSDSECGWARAQQSGEKNGAGEQLRSHQRQLVFGNLKCDIVCFSQRRIFQHMLLKTIFYLLCRRVLPYSSLFWCH